MEKFKKTAKTILCIAIILMLLSMSVVCYIQTDGGNIKVDKLKLETDEGYTMSAWLYRPVAATNDTPAPAIVTSHGSLNNKEMMDMSFIEMSRRGFVVLAVDQPSHGNSDNVKKSQNTAVYQGVLLLSRLPYVDSTRIGVTGHSMGGISCKNAVLLDLEQGTELIAAMFLNSSAPAYKDENGAYYNAYGTVDVGLFAPMYDEFGFSHTDANGEKLLAPFYMQSPDAHSFMHFGVDPTGLEQREAGVLYHETIEGEDVIRGIYTAPICHPWAHFSTATAAGMVEFFDEALDSPVDIPSSNQVWHIKEIFNFIGAIGFAMFVASFAALMVFTPYFSDLRASEPVAPRVVDKKGKLWFWGGLTASAVVSSLIFVPTLLFGFSQNVSQKQGLGLGLWSTFSGIFAIIVMAVFYYTYGKKNGFDLADAGVKLPVKKLGKTVLLALIVIAVSYGWVFFADYFFQTDFRLWTFAIKAFEADKVYRTIPYMWLFLVFYIASSVSANCFNYNTVGGKFNNLIVTLFTTAPALVLPWIQYGKYVLTNQMHWTTMYEYLAILWLFPVVIILFGATYLSRFIYKATKNPYIAGIVNGIIVASMTTANTWMYFGYKLG